MKRLVSKYSMGNGWEWVIVVLMAPGLVYYLVSARWTEAVLVAIIIVSNLHLWRTRLKLERALSVISEQGIS